MVTFLLVSGLLFNHYDEPIMVITMTMSLK